MTKHKANKTTDRSLSTFLSNIAVINFVGLEPQLSDKVHIAWVATLGGDQTKRGRIKILIRENEIRMVQNVDGRGLDLKPNSFRDPDPLRHTNVDIGVNRAVETVDREIAECTRRRSRHQAGL